MDDYYDLLYGCDNCLRGFLVLVPVSQRAEHRPLVCPVCGVKDVRKTNKNVKWLNAYTIDGDKLIVYHRPDMFTSA